MVKMLFAWKNARKVMEKCCLNLFEWETPVRIMGNSTNWYQLNDLDDRGFLMGTSKSSRTNFQACLIYQKVEIVGLWCWSQVNLRDFGCRVVVAKQGQGGSPKNAFFWFCWWNTVVKPFCLIKNIYLVLHPTSSVIDIKWGSTLLVPVYPLGCTEFVGWTTKYAFILVLVHNKYRAWKRLLVASRRPMLSPLFCCVNPEVSRFSKRWTVADHGKRCFFFSIATTCFFPWALNPTSGDSPIELWKQMRSVFVNTIEEQRL